MSYEPRPYQRECIETVESSYRRGRRSVLIVLPTGMGKCLAQNTPVLMHDGSIKAVQDVRQDDLLMGADSSPRRVLSTCTGMEMMWRVVPVKGDPYVVNESHILSLKMTNGATKGSGAKGSGYMPGTVHNISVADYLNTSKTFKHCAKGYRVGVQFPFRETDPALPPYLLGLWLGDGSSDSPIITNPDVEIQDWLQGYCDSIQGLQLSHYRYESQCDQMRIHSGRNPHANPMLDALRAHDLLHNKHVPYIYKCNSEEVRLEVLAGIIDTDGHLTCGGYDLIFKQQRLADDVAYLSRSLGMAAYVKSCRKGIKSRGFESDYWRVSISGDVSRIPVKIGRKKSSARRQVKDVLMTGIRVEPVGIGDYYGFELDGDGLFLLGDFTVTHNTNTFVWLIQRRFERGDRRAALIVAHREELLTQAADRIRALAPELSVGIERAEDRAERGSQVVVASVQTISRGTRLQGFRPGLVVIDEAHHAAAKGYGKVLEQFAGPQTQILGVTATPKRLDRKAISGAAAVFEEVAYSYGIRQAIQDGWLCDLRGYRVETDTDLSGIATRQGDFAAGELSEAVDNEARTAAALRHWKEVARDRRTVVFCAGVEHSRHVADAFREAGVSAEMVSGDLKRDDRTAIIDRFRSGRTQVLANCEVLTEGFDVPEASCALLLRPTQSWGLYVQMVGRVTRIADGKRDAVVIDVVDNCNRHNLATVPAILDLPPGLDLEGNSLLQAARALDEIGEKAVVLQKSLPGSWSELQTMLTQVDLFANLGTPEELGDTPYRWLRMPGGYEMSCGKGRTARLEENALGQWALLLTERNASGRTLIEKQPVGREIADAADVAGQAALNIWPDAEPLVLREARWMQDRPTEKQVEWLRKKGVAESVIETISKGDASALLSKLFSIRGGSQSYARR